MPTVDQLFPMQGLSVSVDRTLLLLYAFMAVAGKKFSLQAILLRNLHIINNVLIYFYIPAKS